MKKTIKKIAKSAGIGLLPSDRLDQLFSIESSAEELLNTIQAAIDLEGHSKAQLKQDIFVLLATQFKRDGFFVEFGATNGMDLSNTYLLEKTFNWRGILAEPAKVWHESLAQNRSAIIEHDCVWSRSDQRLQFNMVDEAEFSTISEFSDRDQHALRRQKGDTYEVTTISLNDLLAKHNAPQQIDYLSIDTEGSEFEILSHFDFDRYDISVITCEHNFTADREKIYSLLTQAGYVRKFEGFSNWDDWYFKI